MDSAILAGGKSQRMGQPKPFVKLGGRPLISWVMEALQPLCREVFIVADRAEPFGMFGSRVVRDHIPDQGPMGGIYTALSSTNERQIFVSACDTPFLKPQIVQFLSSQTAGYEIVVCRLADGLHPLQAVYTKGCISRMHDCIIAGRLSLIDFLQGPGVRVVHQEEIEPLDPQRISFLNINTPQDLELATALLLRRKGDPVQRGL